MMQSITVQLCALGLIVMICIFSFGKQHIPLYRTRIFKRLLFVTTVCIMTDILSIVAIVYAPGIVAYTACKAYLFMIIFTAMFMLQYVCYDISGLRGRKKLRAAIYIFTGISSVAMLLMPLEYLNQDGQIYSYGLSVDFTFVVAPLYILSAFLVTHIFKDRINPHRRNAVRIWLIIQSLGAVVQVIDRHLLLISYGMALGITIIFAKLEIPDENIDRTKADQIGMLATVMNCIYVSEIFRSTGMMTNILTPFECGSFTKLFSKDRANKYFSKNMVVFFAGGTGHPYFSTDTGVVLRAVEVDADVILLAKSIDGVYDADPSKNPDAKKYTEVSIDEVIAKNLQVVDMTASILARDNKMPMWVFGLNEENSIINTVKGKFNGTKVTV